MLQDADVEVQHIIKEKVGRIEASIPFSTVTKRSITAVRLLERPDIVRVFLKGAPELVVPKCIRTFEVDGKIKNMHDDEMNYILQDMLVEKFAQRGYRTMAFAYKDISIEAFNGLKKTFNNFETESDREILET